MLSRFDDYPIHQTPDPIAMPASSDRDVYERYWFNGYTTNESDPANNVFFAAATAVYPHLGLRDCSLSVVVDGTQHSFHASQHIGADPHALSIGPYQLDLVEPMRSAHITIGPNDTGMTADLVYEARSGNVEEPRHHFVSGIRRGMDTTRFTQLGRWSGWIDIAGRRIELDAATTKGTKDRSWGLRPLAGGDTRGAPRPRGGLFFLWAPLHFDDFGIHYQLFEDHLGRTLFSVGAQLPLYPTADAVPGIEDPAVQHMRHNEHALTFERGSRQIETVTLAMTSLPGSRLPAATSVGDTGDTARHEIELDKIYTFRMKGLGYGHPEWGHGVHHGELAVGLEQWDMATIDESDPTFHHVQHFVQARMGDHSGIGALEQLIAGPYAPYGLTGAFDPLET